MSSLSEVPEGQGLSDFEDQANEFMVLESILDADQFVYSRKSEALPAGQIQVDVQLPKDFLVSVRTKNSGAQGGDGSAESSNPSSSSGSVQEKFRIRTAEVRYLPPVTLLFTLPLGYPSTEPPLYTLQSSWLNREKLSQLCLQLDEIWESQKGTVVLFSWITFLREEALKVIGCEAQFDVALQHQRRTAKHEVSASEPSSAKKGKSPSALKGPGHNHVHHRHLEVALDQRAVFSNATIRDKEVLFNILLEYNKEREEIEFRKHYHTCSVCFSDKAGAEFVKLGCSHFFCKGCMNGCYSTYISEGSVDGVKCLALKCSGMPSAAQVREIVGSELFEKYDGILLQRALEGMSDLVYCPRSQCMKPVIVEPNEKLAICSHCQYRFCSICKMVFHGVEPCRFKSEEKKRLFEEYTKASKEEKLLLERTYGKKQLALLVESTLSEKYIEKQSKPCPHCKIPIEKFEGCNKVTCTKCGSYFCWMCLHQLSKDNPYFHFQDPQSPCYNMLFQDEEGEEGEEDDEDIDWSDVDEDFSDSDFEDFGNDL